MVNDFGKMIEGFMSSLRDVGWLEDEPVDMELRKKLRQANRAYGRASQTIHQLRMENLALRAQLKEFRERPQMLFKE